MYYCFSGEHSSTYTEPSVKPADASLPIEDYPEIENNALLDTSEDHNSQTKNNLTTILYQDKPSLLFQLLHNINKSNRSVITAPSILFAPDEDIINSTAHQVENLDVEGLYGNMEIALISALLTILLALLVIWIVRMQKISNNDASSIALNEATVLRQKESKNKLQRDNEEIKARCTYKRVSGQASMTSGELLIN